MRKRLDIELAIFGEISASLLGHNPAQLEDSNSHKAFFVFPFVLRSQSLRTRFRGAHCASRTFIPRITGGAAGRIAIAKTSWIARRLDGLAETSGIVSRIRRNTITCSTV